MSRRPTANTIQPAVPTSLPAAATLQDFVEGAAVSYLPTAKDDGEVEAAEVTAGLADIAKAGICDVTCITCGSPRASSDNAGAAGKSAIELDTLPTQPPRVTTTKTTASTTAQSFLSQWSNSSTAKLTRPLSNSPLASKAFRRIFTLISFTALLISVIGFWPSFGQYYYTKVTYDKSVDSENQTIAFQLFELRTKYYQTCQLNKLVNSAVEDPACDEVLAGQAPELPFPYAAPNSQAMNKFKRRLLEAICDCSCPNGRQELPTSPVSPSELTPDSHSSSRLPLLGLLACIAIVLLLRNKPRIISKLRKFSKKDFPNFPGFRSPSEVLRAPRHINGQAISEKEGHSSAASTSSTIARRRKVPQEVRHQTLWQAAASKDMDTVQYHLGSGMFRDINALNSRYGTPLCAACEGGSIQITKLMLDRGADVNSTGGRFSVSIQAAAYSGNTALVRILLEHGARVNFVGGWSGSPLQAAAERGDVEMVKMIADAGADVTVGGGSLGFPLQGAASVAHFDNVAFLLERGADVNAEGGEYGCALNAAVSCGSLEIVKLLLDNGANVNLPPGGYGNCVQIALRNHLPSIARILLDKGADGDVKDDQGRTPLIEASIMGDEGLVKTLLKRGVNVNAQDDDKWPALHHVALAGQNTIAKLLIENGANVTLKDKFGAPALHRASDNGHVTIAMLLLDNGADINARDVMGATALRNCPFEPFMRFLLSRGADTNVATNMGETPLHSAVNANNLGLVRALLEAGCNTSLQDNDQATCLYKSINKGYYDIAWELLDRGADINTRSSNAFQEAISKGQIALVKAMIEKGASINAQGNQFGSPLQAACTSADSLELVNLLLDHKANVNLPGGEHGCALSAAAYHGHSNSVRALLERGANPNLQGVSRYGCPLRAAQSCKDGVSAEVKAEIIAMLRERGAHTNIVGAITHDDDVWRLTPAGWSWLPGEVRKDISSRFGADSQKSFSS